MFAILIATIASSYAWTNDWAEQIQSDSSTQPGNVRAIAPSGDRLMVAGTFGGTITFGGWDTYTSNGGTDIYIAAFDPVTGDYLGAVTYGSSNNDWIYEMTTDDAGEIYITGSFVMPITFGATTLTTNGSADWFVAKLDVDGAPVWANSGGSVGYDYPYDIEVDSLGNVYACGVYKGDADFGALNATNAGAGSGLVIKYNSDGTEQWLQTLHSSTDTWTRLNKIAISADDSVYVASQFHNEVTMAGFTFSPTGAQDAFITHLAADGTHDFTRTIKAGVGQKASIGSILEHDGKLYVAGSFNGSATIGVDTIVNSSASYSGGFFAALDVPSTDWDFGKHPNGFQFNANDITHVSGPWFALAGTHREDLLVNGTTYTNEGERDVAVVRIRKNGNPFSAISSASPADEGSHGLFSKGAALYHGGAFGDEAIFGPSVFINNGGEDGHVERLPKTQF